MGLSTLVRRTWSAPEPPEDRGFAAAHGMAPTNPGSECAKYTVGTRRVQCSEPLRKLTVIQGCITQYGHAA